MLYKMRSVRVNKERAVATSFVGFGFRPSSRGAGFHPGEAVMTMGWDILFVQQQWPVARTQRRGFLEWRKLGKYHLNPQFPFSLSVSAIQFFVFAVFDLHCSIYVCTVCIYIPQKKRGNKVTSQLPLTPSGPGGS